jgi:diamine N-acetyltransferase
VDRGLGTDATLTLLEYYFEELKFDRLYLDVASLNKRAIRCYEKCGFTFIRKKYNDHDPRSNIDIFGDDRFKNIRRYFVKNGDKVLVEFDEMEITREMYETKTKSRWWSKTQKSALVNPQPTGPAVQAAADFR